MDSIRAHHQLEQAGLRGAFKAWLIPWGVALLLVACSSGCDGGGGSGTPPVAAPPASFVYPLEIDPTSRYLMDQYGKPFLLVGDAAWSLFAALSDADAETYLANRQQRGFTAVMASLIEHKFAPNAPENAYGIKPFTGAPFTTPNPGYFAHVDTILQSAAAKGIVVFLDVLYLGIGCGDEGWCQEVGAASIDDMRFWGQYVGNRYKNYDNIVWVIGGDADPSRVQAQVEAMVDGIRSVDSRHLFTAHNGPESMAVTPWFDNNGVVAPWLTVNNVYTYSVTLYEKVLNAYSLPQAMPVFLVETAYENMGQSPQELRAQSYWTVLSGGVGHMFGNCPIWGFGPLPAFCNPTDWKAELNKEGSVSMQHFAALFNSRHWHLLVPDTSPIPTILTDGFGTFGNTNYAQAACVADGSSIIAYLPSARTVSVNGACLVDTTMKVWWYNPRSGKATEIIETYQTRVPQSLPLPPTNEDWVLVLDSASFSSSFPPPGSK